MTTTKTSASKKDRDELAKELARRKAEPVRVEKPVDNIVRDRSGGPVKADAFFAYLDKIGLGAVTK